MFDLRRGDEPTSVLGALTARVVCGLALACVMCTAGTAACSRARRSPASDPRLQGAFAWRLPAGFPTPRVPADNPMTLVKIELGRRLFYDTRLSANATFSCASCHQQAHAFTDGKPRAVGSTGGMHARSAMTLTNVVYNASFGWADPSLRTLEGQMAVPLFNEHPIELGLKNREAEIVRRFTTADDTAWFTTAFPAEPGSVTLTNIVKAIATFERTLMSGDSPFDRYLYRHDKSGMSQAALDGVTLFFSSRLGCAECHGSFNLSGPVTFAGAEKIDALFHNTGLYDVDGKGGYPAIDRGLFDLTRLRGDMGKFRAPTLRNVAVTAPYMHDGSIATLADTLDHYASGGKESEFRSDRVRGFRMTGAERSALLAFLETLTDQQFLTNPAFGPPK
jgi:cytochrome c peroxidase